MPRLAVLALLPVFLLTGCGYIGSPLPPLANIPARVGDIAAVQREGRIIVRFTIPTVTTEGFPIRGIPTLDLRIGSVTVNPFRGDLWAEQARQIPEAPVDKGAATYAIPSAEWTGKDVTIAVRVIGENGKHSEWSNFLNLQIVSPPEKPANLKAESTAAGVKLTWDGAPGDFRVFRHAADEKTFGRIAEAAQNTFTDTTTEYGKLYTYVVQRIVKLAGGHEAESEPSTEAQITPVDVFPPATPAGLRAVPAPASVELSWERNTEPDLAAYRIYRAAPGGDFERIAEVTQIPSYSDHAVEHGKTYRYAVTAVDQTGNESARSAAVEASVL
jgi:fibronectin type 3 domain-containing protein